jgi:hypothetical protein
MRDLMAVTVNITVFLDVTPCSLLEVYRRSSETSVNFFKLNRISSQKTIIFTKLTLNLNLC